MKFIRVDFVNRVFLPGSNMPNGAAFWEDQSGTPDSNRSHRSEASDAARGVIFSHAGRRVLVPWQNISSTELKEEEEVEKPSPKKGGRGRSA